MSSRRTSAIIALVVGPIAGAAYPFVQLALDCRAPQSEACVWGKSLLPFTLAISVPLLGAVVSIAVFVLLEWRRKAQEDE